MLTKEERRRLRRQNRAEREREKQDKVALGLMPAPEPKVKISNMMRVLGEQAVADPSRIEATVLAAVASRQHNHDMRNLARMLTPEERRAKNAAKMAEATTLEAHVAVFYVADLSCGQKRFKIDVNAQQSHLTGGVIVCLTQPVNLVVVEGGAKGIKRFVKLMTRRIDWDRNADDASDGEGGGMDDDDSDNGGGGGAGGKGGKGAGNVCALVWQGTVPKKAFNTFRFQECRTPETARKVMEAKGCAHYWDSVEVAAAGGGAHELPL